MPEGPRGSKGHFNDKIGGHMEQDCKACRAEIIDMREQQSRSNITGGICVFCIDKISKAGEVAKSRKILDAIDAPVLLMQSEPRQVFTANNKALELFNKKLSQIEGRRGGEVFDCVHSFTEAGCGKDINCDNCRIKKAVVETFVTGKSFEGISTVLQITEDNEIRSYDMQVSTEKVGDLALLRIDRFVNSKIK